MWCHLDFYLVTLFICRRLLYVLDRFSDVEVSFNCKALPLDYFFLWGGVSDVSLHGSVQRDVIFLRIQSDSKHTYELNF